MMNLRTEALQEVFSEPPVISFWFYELLVTRLFSDESSPQAHLMQSSSFEENHRLIFILVICGAGLVNMVMLPFCAYKNVVQIVVNVNGMSSLSDKWFTKESSC